MTPSLLAASLGAVLVVFLALRGRRPATFLRSTDSSAVAALNRSQIEMVQASTQDRNGAADGAATSTFPFPVVAGASDPQAGLVATIRPSYRRNRQVLACPESIICFEALQKRDRLRQLSAWIQGDPGERLRAIQNARRWGNRATLPILRRGLRDPDPTVMREAALAMEMFRGRTGIAPGSGQPLLVVSRPRSVARTR